MTQRGNIMRWICGLVNVCAKIHASVDALYEKQKHDRKGELQGKRKQMEQNHHDFWSQETARADVEAYMNSEQETVSLGISGCWGKDAHT